MQDETDPGVGGAPAGEDVGEDADGDGVDGGDVQFAAPGPGGGARGAAGLGGAADGAFGVGQEGAAHRGEAHSARQPFEEGLADGPFQGLDLVGERRLG